MSNPAPARSRKTARLWLDSLPAIGLAVALAAVYAVDGCRSASRSESLLRLAVTPPEYDDMGKLLDSLGAGYRYSTISYDDLLDPQRLAALDVVFLTCSGVPRHWVGRQIGQSDRDGAGVFRPRPEIVEAVRKSLRQFVGNGGTLYVSDLHFQLLELAFPEFIDRHHVAEGAIQTVQAEVVDPGLRRRLGASIPLHFDKQAWRPAAFAAPEMLICLRGQYRLGDGGIQTSGPLLVLIPYEQGAIVFTSFHNEKQASQLEQELLRYLVFASVTAREGARVQRTLVRGGFSPADRNLLSASSGSEAVSYQYESRGGALRFVLGFQAQGAELHLGVLGPDGTRLERSGGETFEIEVPQAAPGTWRYTVTPVTIPYPNFPFTLTVGEKGAQEAPEK